MAEAKDFKVHRRTKAWPRPDEKPVRGFAVDELDVSYDGFAGSPIEHKTRIVFERGDAVAALLYDPDKRVVLFTDQFRAATIPMPELNRAGSKRGGWIYETAAGIVGPNDKMEDVLKNRLVKETGYQVSATVEIASFYPSPGGCSELIKLYYAEVRLSEKDGQGSENEIKLVDRSVDLFFKQLANREFEDAKLIIAGYWLKDRLQRDEDNRPLYSRESYRIKGSKDRYIGYCTGDILDTTDVDVWVNPLNTDMMLDRFTDKTVAATIRRHGAQKFPNNKARILRDTIGDALVASMHPRKHVELASVLDTTPGDLEFQPYNVRRLFHVAVIDGVLGETGTEKPKIDVLDRCVDRVLTGIEASKGFAWQPNGLRSWPIKRRYYGSVIFPMLGTGNGGLLVGQVAPRLVDRALDFFARRRRTRLKEIYFLAYWHGDQDVLATKFKELVDAGKLEYEGTER